MARRQRPEGSARPYDLVVIGTGTAGSTVASSCRAAGWDVAVIDARPYGGTCALRGCDPKKVLVGAAQAVDQVRRLEGSGVAAGGAGIRWPELMRFKREFTDPVPGAKEDRFRDSGIDTFHGHARFLARPGVLDLGGEEIETRHVLIATGAVPADLGIPGADRLATSDDFLELESLPRRLVFVGGGYIAFELAQVAARAGAEVTILHRGSRALERFDGDLTARLVERTRALGVEVELEAEVRRVEAEGAGARVHALTTHGERSYEADLAVHAAGRVPHLDLGLDVAGVAHAKDGVRVNGFLQSETNPSVYAAGDAAAGGPPLTPTASYDGKLAADNLLKGNHRERDYTGIPSVVFTEPPLAMVGLTEEAARAQDLRFEVHSGDTSGWYSSRRLREPVSGYKVLVEAGTGRILGAHVLGPSADEQINLFALAVRKGLGADDLRSTLFAYPTHASDIGSML